MKHWLVALAAGLVVAICGALLTLTPVGATFEQNFGLVWLFHMRGPITPPKEVAIIAIDDQTGSHLGLSNLPREWPRTIHAQLVRNLTRLGASVISFDFDFQLPKKPADDAAFSAAVAASQRVVLAERLVGKRRPVLDRAGYTRGSVWMEQLVPPIAPLANAARGLGSFPLPKVDVAVHEFWAFKPSVGDAPTMPVVALQIHALRAYASLRALIAANAPGKVSALPHAPLSLSAADLRSTMLELRRVFTQHPGLVARSADELPTDSAQPPTGVHHLLTSLQYLYVGPDQRFLNFYGPPGTITTIPYHQMAGANFELKNQALPDLTGTAVFVGFSDLYDPGQPDRFNTVFTSADGVDLSGVEIAATGFANLLTNRTLHPATIRDACGALAVFGLLVGVAAFALRPLLGITVTLGLGGLYALLAYHAFSGFDYWLPFATPLLVQLPLALFIGLLAQYRSEREKKARATRAISLYLPAHLARDITEQRMDEEALNRVTYSVCFASDMAGFTTIAERLKPKELATFLNDYFESLSAPLRRHQVDVIEFRADGIMCAWTAEQASGEVHQRAILAALEAVQTIELFKQRYVLLSQSLRIGLETGMVYVGHAGGGGHFVYSIVGDCANTAARIEGLNKHLGTQLLAGASVIEGVTGILTRFVGNFRFVGKSEPMPIVEIIALDSIASDSQRKLCADFNRAMEHMENRHWAAAVQGFAGILDEYPTDGPATFHRARCQAFELEAPTESPLIVRMDVK